MGRGEVWWADLPSPIGFRPVVLISRNDSYRYRNMVIVTTVSRRIRGIWAEVHLGPEEGLRFQSTANLDNIMTIPKAALQEYISTLSEEKMQQVDAAIHYTLGLEN